MFLTSFLYTESESESEREKDSNLDFLYEENRVIPLSYKIIDSIFHFKNIVIFLFYMIIDIMYKIRGSIKRVMTNFDLTGCKT